jgi:hypothetical protein
VAFQKISTNITHSLRRRKYLSHSNTQFDRKHKLKSNQKHIVWKGLFQRKCGLEQETEAFSFGYESI